MGLTLKKTKVLVVDDSAFMRKVISRMISSDPEFEVAGIARDGLDAIEKMREVQPDVITLDVEMPRMNGLEALQVIMAERPTPVVMLSGLTQENADTTIKALALGAVDFVAKPSGAISLDIEKVRDILLSKIRVARRAKLRLSEKLRQRAVDEDFPGKAGIQASPGAAGAPGAIQVSGVTRTPGATRVPGVADTVVVIGSSTGGPGALQEVIPRLPRDLAAGVLVVQHMPAGFTRSLAMRLNEASQLDVREAAQGDPVIPGTVLVAPGGRHLAIRDDRTVDLSDAPPVHGVRPAVDITLESAVKVFGSRVIGVIMTGMGFDGARGISLVKAKGGFSIVQDEETSVVWGMPRAVVEMGNADRICPLDEIAQAVVTQLRRNHRRDNQEKEA
ncbi:MAG TPA: chemotaxis response regulator protein-glutamate methylesterase [Firmicutes bacterium]|nr:chemotaxis response regulator protein-glutamate methylesterase [Bacillota bacterium]